jgi:hypothetical protein
VAHVLRQLAGIMRTLHDAGFAPNDPKRRNLLVDGGELPTVHLIDCPSRRLLAGRCPEIPPHQGSRLPQQG